jgi:SAM-dependent methyltransferase
VRWYAVAPLLALLGLAGSAAWLRSPRPRPVSGEGAPAEASLPGRLPASKIDVEYVPTPQDVVEAMLELAGVAQDDVVYDLGCGDGRIVVTAARKYGCRAVGIDIDPIRVEESLDSVRRNQVEHLVRIEEGDIFTADLTGATVVTLYLLPHLNERLLPQLEVLPPGARVVSQHFSIRGLLPDRIVHHRCAETGSRSNLFLWTVPFRRLPSRP